MKDTKLFSSTTTLRAVVKLFESSKKMGHKAEIKTEKQKLYFWKMQHVLIPKQHRLGLRLWLGLE